MSISDVNTDPMIAKRPPSTVNAVNTPTIAEMGASTPAVYQSIASSALERR